MKFLKGLAVFLIILICSTFLCAAIGLTAASYYAVNELVKATAPEPIATSKSSKKTPSVKASLISVPTDFQLEEASDPNLKSLVKIGRDYKNELAVFDQMLFEISMKKSPDFCHIVCNPTYLDKERIREERSPYLAKYYQEQGVRAMQDPVFRMKLAEVGFISRLYPQSLRDVLTQIENMHSHSANASSKLLIALKLEAAVLSEVSALSLRLDSMKIEADKFRDFRQLIHSCQQGVLSPKEARGKCETLSAI